MQIHSAVWIIAAGLLSVSGTAGAGTYPAPTSQNAPTAPHHTGDVVYTCPMAGCDYENAKAGQCPNHHKALERMSLNYTCPKDGKEVAGSGQCPRCAMDAAQHKMASAASATKATKTKMKVKMKPGKKAATAGAAT